MRHGPGGFALAYKQSHVEKLLRSSNETRVKEGLSILYPEVLFSSDRILPHLKTMKKDLSYLTPGSQATILDMFARSSEKRPDIFVDMGPDIASVLRGTVRQTRRYRGSFTAGARALDLAINLLRTGNLALDPDLVNSAFLCLMPPIYITGAPPENRDPLYYSAIRFLAGAAALRPDIVGSPDRAKLLASLHADTYRIGRYRQGAGDRGGIRQTAQRCLHAICEADPRRSLLMLISSLSPSATPEQRGGSAALLSSLATSPEVVKATFSIIATSDMRTSRLASAAAILFLLNDPRIVSEHLNMGLGKGASKKMKMASLSILAGAAGPSPEKVLPLLGALVNVLQDPDPQYRVGAMQAIAIVSARDPERCRKAIDWMIKMLDDPDPRVSGEAVNGIAGVSATRPELVRASVPYLLRFVSDPQRKFKAVEALSRLGIDVNSYVRAVSSLASVWNAVREWDKIGYDCSDIDENMQSTRGLIKKMAFKDAINVMENTSRAIASFPSTHIPFIETTVDIKETPTMGSWNPIIIGLENHGRCTAHNIRITSPILVNTQDLIVVTRLPVGKHHDISIRWNPDISGPVPLGLKVLYQDPLGGSHESVTEIEIEIEGPAPSGSRYSPDGYAEDLQLEQGYAATQEQRYAQTEVPEQNVVEDIKITPATFEESFGKELVPPDSTQGPDEAEALDLTAAEAESITDGSATPDDLIAKPASGVIPEKGKGDKLQDALDRQKKLREAFDLEGIMQGIMTVENDPMLPDGGTPPPEALPVVEEEEICQPIKVLIPSAIIDGKDGRQKKNDGK